MISVEPSSATSGSGTPTPVSTGSRTPRSILLAIAVVILAASVVTGRPAAAAGPVAGLQAQAAAVSRQLVQEQLQVGGYQQQYQADAAVVEQDAATIGLAQAAIAQDARRVADDHRRLVQQVVTAYIASGATGAGGFASVFDPQPGSDLARGQYEQVAIGNVSDSIAALHLDERRLGTAKASLERRQANDRALLSQQAVLLQRSQSTQVTIEGQLTQINGQLAVAVAQQQAAQAAAAAAAIRAADAAAVAAAAKAQRGAPAPPATGAPAPPATAAPVAGGPISDPALNAFLQCVVQQESGGDYAAVSANGLYMGAFQFSQATWNQAAQMAGLPALVGVPPNTASRAAQDTLAVALYALDGQQPWYDPCRTA